MKIKLSQIQIVVSLLLLSVGVVMFSLGIQKYQVYIESQATIPQIQAGPSLPPTWYTQGEILQTGPNYEVSSDVGRTELLFPNHPADGATGDPLSYWPSTGYPGICWGAGASTSEPYGFRMDNNVSPKYTRLWMNAWHTEVTEGEHAGKVKVCSMVQNVDITSSACTPTGREQHIYQVHADLCPGDTADGSLNSCLVGEPHGCTSTSPGAKSLTVNIDSQNRGICPANNGTDFGEAITTCWYIEPEDACGKIQWDISAPKPVLGGLDNIPDSQCPAEYTSGSEDGYDQGCHYIGYVYYFGTEQCVPDTPTPKPTKTPTPSPTPTTPPECNSDCESDADCPTGLFCYFGTGGTPNPTPTLSDLPGSTTYDPGCYTDYICTNLDDVNSIFTCKDPIHDNLTCKIDPNCGGDTSLVECKCTSCPPNITPIVGFNALSVIGNCRLPENPGSSICQPKPPTATPTTKPSNTPTVTSTPIPATGTPTPTATKTPTPTPTATNTPTPTATNTPIPTNTPTATPTNTPIPTNTPTPTPTPFTCTGPGMQCTPEACPEGYTPRNDLTCAEDGIVCCEPVPTSPPPVAQAPTNTPVPPTQPPAQQPTNTPVQDLTVEGQKPGITPWVVILMPFALILLGLVL